MLNETGTFLIESGVIRAFSSLFPAFVERKLKTWGMPRLRRRLYSVGRSSALGLDASKTSAGRRSPLAIGPWIRLRCFLFICSALLYAESPPVTSFLAIWPTVRELPRPADLPIGTTATHFILCMQTFFYFGLSHAAFLTARYQFIYGLRRTTLNCTTAPVVLTIWIMPLCMTLNRGPRVSSNERTCISNVRSLSDGDCWFQRGKIVPCFFGSQTGILI